MDPLASLLEKFRLQASVFHIGPLCSGAAFTGNPGTGYIHNLKAGKLKVVTNNVETTLLSAPATIFYSQPVSHKLIPIEGEIETNLVCGSIDFGASGQIMLSMGLPDFLVLTENEINPLRPILELLFAESVGTLAGKQSALNRVCELLVIQLYRYLMATGNINSSLLAGLSDPHLSKLLAALHESPEQVWTLERMAGICGTSRAPFAKRFKEVLGMPAVEYLTLWRMALVQTLLIEGKPITVAAMDVGYESPSAMSRVFRQKFGMSPSEWLQTQSKQEIM